MIRDAREDDIPQIVWMGRRAFESGGYQRFVDFDPYSAAMSVRAFIDSPDVAFVVCDRNHLVGMAAALIAPLYFNREKRLAQEIFWWIEPDHMRETKSLLIALETASMSKGAAVMLLPSLTLSASRLYQRMGYQPMEHYHMKALS